jgi:hypothetical protein
MRREAGIMDGGEHAVAKQKMADIRVRLRVLREPQVVSVDVREVDQVDGIHLPPRGSLA